MKNLRSLKFFLLVLLIYSSEDLMAQDEKIQELDFLIGTWETREDNLEQGWWETSTRKIKYTLKGNYIELQANSVDSNGKEREYTWYINYNKKTKQFEMVSMFSNWYKTQFDILVWDRKQRKLTIQNKPNSETEFHERFGEIIFNDNFNEYTWTGENKYGDPNKPNVWKYIEKGTRIK